MSDCRYIDPLPVRAVIQEMLEHYRCNDFIYETRINNIWHVVMGAMIAKHTKGLRVRNSVLSVWLDSSVLREELFFAKDKIISMLNKELKITAIKDIILK